VPDYLFYELHPLSLARPKRSGALLRFRFDGGLIGYADCHPWPELGDAPLQRQLEILRSGAETTLLRRARFWARIDAEARSRGENLLRGVKVPKSHFHLSDVERGGFEAFSRIKIKVDLALEKDRKAVLSLCQKSGAFLRLDFNERASEEQYVSFREAIAPYADRIEFCEDPFPFDPEKWRRQQHFGAIAADRPDCCDPEAARFRIYKPALQEPPTPSGQRVVVTSYLDHPLGQTAAAYAAAQLTDEVCGLLSHYAYHKNSFSELLASSGPEFKAPEGSGFGFDHLLEKMAWRRL